MKKTLLALTLALGSACAIGANSHWFESTSIPEPMTLAMVVSGLLAAAVTRGRRA